MSGQPKGPESGAVPDFIAYLFEPRSFMIGTLDTHSSASRVLDLSNLAMVTSVDTPEAKSDSEAFRTIPSEYLYRYSEELAHHVFSSLTDGKEHCLNGPEFERLFNKHFGKLASAGFADYPKGCAVVRTSKSDWKEEEIEGQKERLRQVLLEMFARGFVPAMVVADAQTGSKMVRQGILIALGAAIREEIDGVFVHTLERFSRSELDGLLMLVLTHWLTGNVFYLAQKFDAFVEFDSQSRQSQVLAAEEIVRGADEGERIRSRFRRGKRGVVQGSRYDATIGYRLFHGARA